MEQTRRGMTLIEILIALVVLAVGILALASTSAMTTRMIGRGKVETRAALAASRRMEELRLAAHGSTPRCSAPSFASGGPIVSGAMTESWQVPATGKIRRVRVTVSYLTVRGIRSAELETAVQC